MVADQKTAELIYYLTFTNNFNFIKNGLPDASILGVLWSIAVEEQFYLVWPLIVALFPNTKLWLAFLLILSGTMVFRAVYMDPIIHEHHTFSCIGDMTIGALAAWLVQFEHFKNRIIKLQKTWIIVIYILFALFFFFRAEIFHFANWMIVIERSIIALVIALIILEQCYSENSLYKFSKFKQISKLGLITYGLYCLHFIGILVVTNLTKKLGFNTELWQVLVVDSTLSLILTIVIAKISFQYFEKPFLRLKDSFSRI